jgi:hypothetical protein
LPLEIGSREGVELQVPQMDLGLGEATRLLVILFT